MALVLPYRIRMSGSPVLKALAELTGSSSQRRRINMARYQNVLKKYGITEQQLKTQGVDVVSKSLGNICNVQVLFAIAELLCNGDIEEAE